MFKLLAAKLDHSLCCEILNIVTIPNFGRFIPVRCRAAQVKRRSLSTMSSEECAPKDRTGAKKTKGPDIGDGLLATERIKNVPVGDSPSTEAKALVCLPANSRKNVRFRSVFPSLIRKSVAFWNWTSGIRDCSTNVLGKTKGSLQAQTTDGNPSKARRTRRHYRSGLQMSRRWCQTECFRKSSKRGGSHIYRYHVLANDGLNRSLLRGKIYEKDQPKLSVDTWPVFLLSDSIFNDEVSEEAELQRITRDVNLQMLINHYENKECSADAQHNLKFDNRLRTDGNYGPRTIQVHQRCIDACINANRMKNVADRILQSGNQLNNSYWRSKLPNIAAHQSLSMTSPKKSYQVQWNNQQQAAGLAIGVGAVARPAGIGIEFGQLSRSGAPSVDWSHSAGATGHGVGINIAGRPGGVALEYGGAHGSMPGVAMAHRAGSRSGAAGPAIGVGGVARPAGIGIEFGQLSRSGEPSVDWSHSAGATGHGVGIDIAGRPGGVAIESGGAHGSMSGVAMAHRAGSSSGAAGPALGVGAVAQNAGYEIEFGQVSRIGVPGVDWSHFAGATGHDVGIDIAGRPGGVAIKYGGARGSMPGLAMAHRAGSGSGAAGLALGVGGVARPTRYGIEFGQLSRSGVPGVDWSHSTGATGHGVGIDIDIAGRPGGVEIEYGGARGSMPRLAMAHRAGSRSGAAGPALGVGGVARHAGIGIEFGQLSRSGAPSVDWSHSAGATGHGVGINIAGRPGGVAIEYGGAHGSIPGVAMAHRAGSRSGAAGPAIGVGGVARPAGIGIEFGQLSRSGAPSVDWSHSAGATGHGVGINIAGRPGGVAIEYGGAHGSMSGVAMTHRAGSRSGAAGPALGVGAKAKNAGYGIEFGQVSRIGVPGVDWSHSAGATGHGVGIDIAGRPGGVAIEYGGARGSMPGLAMAHRAGSGSGAAGLALGVGGVARPTRYGIEFGQFSRSGVPSVDWSHSAGATGHGVGSDIAGRPGGVVIDYRGEHGSMPGVTLAHRAGSGSGAAELAFGVGGVARPTRYAIEFGQLSKSGVPGVDWSHSAGATGNGVGIDIAGQPGGVAIEYGGAHGSMPGLAMAHRAGSGSGAAGLALGVGGVARPTRYGIEFGQLSRSGVPSVDWSHSAGATGHGVGIDITGQPGGVAIEYGGAHGSMPGVTLAHRAGSGSGAAELALGVGGVARPTRYGIEFGQLSKSGVPGVDWSHSAGATGNGVGIDIAGQPGGVAIEYGGAHGSMPGLAMAHRAGSGSGAAGPALGVGGVARPTRYGIEFGQLSRSGEPSVDWSHSAGATGHGVGIDIAGQPGGVAIEYGGAHGSMPGLAMAHRAASGSGAAGLALGVRGVARPTRYGIEFGQLSRSGVPGVDWSHSAGATGHGVGIDIAGRPGGVAIEYGSTHGSMPGVTLAQRAGSGSGAAELALGVGGVARPTRYGIEFGQLSRSGEPSVDWSHSAGATGHGVGIDIAGQPGGVAIEYGGAHGSMPGLAMAHRAASGSRTAGLALGVGGVARPAGYGIEFGQLSRSGVPGVDWSHSAGATGHGVGIDIAGRPGGVAIDYGGAHGSMPGLAVAHRAASGSGTGELALGVGGVARPTRYGIEFGQLSRSGVPGVDWSHSAGATGHGVGIDIAGRPGGVAIEYGGAHGSMPGLAVAHRAASGSGTGELALGVGGVARPTRYGIEFGQLSRSGVPGVDWSHSAGATGHGVGIDIAGRPGGVAIEYGGAHGSTPGLAVAHRAASGSGTGELALGVGGVARPTRYGIEFGQLSRSGVPVVDWSHSAGATGHGVGIDIAGRPGGVAIEYGGAHGSMPGLAVAHRAASGSGTGELALGVGGVAKPTRYGIEFGQLSRSGVPGVDWSHSAGATGHGVGIDIAGRPGGVAIEYGGAHGSMPGLAVAHRAACGSGTGELALGVGGVARPTRYGIEFGQLSRSGVPGVDWSHSAGATGHGVGIDIAGRPGGVAIEYGGAHGSMPGLAVAHRAASGSGTGELALGVGGVAKPTRYGIEFGQLSRSGVPGVDWSHSAGATGHGVGIDIAGRPGGVAIEYGGAHGSMPGLAVAHRAASGSGTGELALGVGGVAKPTRYGIEFGQLSRSGVPSVDWSHSAGATGHGVGIDIAGQPGGVAIEYGGAHGSMPGLAMAHRAASGSGTAGLALGVGGVGRPTRYGIEFGQLSRTGVPGVDWSHSAGATGHGVGIDIAGRPGGVAGDYGGAHGSMPGLAMAHRAASGSGTAGLALGVGGVARPTRYGIEFGQLSRTGVPGVDWSHSAGATGHGVGIDIAGRPGGVAGDYGGARGSMPGLAMAHRAASGSGTAGLALGVGGVARPTRYGIEFGQLSRTGVPGVDWSHSAGATGHGVGIDIAGRPGGVAGDYGGAHGSMPGLAMAHRAAIGSETAGLALGVGGVARPAGYGIEFGQLSRTGVPGVDWSHSAGATGHGVGIDIAGRPGGVAGDYGGAHGSMPGLAMAHRAASGSGTAGLALGVGGLARPTRYGIEFGQLSRTGVPGVDWSHSAGATGHGVGIDIAGQPGGVAGDYGGAHGSMPGLAMAHRAVSGSGTAGLALGVGGVARPTRYGIEFGQLSRTGVPGVDWSHSAGATGHGVGIDIAGRPGGVAIEYGGAHGSMPGVTMAHRAGSGSGAAELALGLGGVARPTRYGIELGQLSRTGVPGVDWSHSAGATSHGVGIDIAGQPVGVAGDYGGAHGSMPGLAMAHRAASGSGTAGLALGVGSVARPTRYGIDFGQLSRSGVPSVDWSHSAGATGHGVGVDKAGRPGGVAIEYGGAHGSMPGITLAHRAASGSGTAGLALGVGGVARPTRYGIEFDQLSRTGVPGVDWSHSAGTTGHGVGIDIAGKPGGVAGDYGGAHGSMPGLAMAHRAASGSGTAGLALGVGGVARPTRYGIEFGQLSRTGVPGVDWSHSAGTTGHGVGIDIAGRPGGFAIEYEGAHGSMPGVTLAQKAGSGSGAAERALGVGGVARPTRYGIEFGQLSRSGVPGVDWSHSAGATGHGVGIDIAGRPGGVAFEYGGAHGSMPGLAVAHRAASGSGTGELALGVGGVARPTRYGIEFGQLSRSGVPGVDWSHSAGATGHGVGIDIAGRPGGVAIEYGGAHGSMSGVTLAHRAGSGSGTAGLALGVGGVARPTRYGIEFGQLSRSGVPSVDWSHSAGATGHGVGVDKAGRPGGVAIEYGGAHGSMPGVTLAHRAGTGSGAAGLALGVGGVARPTRYGIEFGQLSRSGVPGVDWSHSAGATGHGVGIDIAGGPGGVAIEYGGAHGSMPGLAVAHRAASGSGTGELALGVGGVARPTRYGIEFGQLSRSGVPGVDWSPSAGATGHGVGIDIAGRPGGVAIEYGGAHGSMPGVTLAHRAGSRSGTAGLALGVGGVARPTRYGIEFGQLSRSGVPCVDWSHSAGATGHGVGDDKAGRPGGVAIEYGGAHGSMPGVTLAHRAGTGSGAAELALGVGGVARPTRYGIEFGQLSRSGLPGVDWGHSAGATGHGVGIDIAGRPGGVAIEYGGAHGSMPGVTLAHRAGSRSGTAGLALGVGGVARPTRYGIEFGQLSRSGVPCVDWSHSAGATGHGVGVDKAGRPGGVAIEYGGAHGSMPGVTLAHRAGTGSGAAELALGVGGVARPTRYGIEFGQLSRSGLPGVDWGHSAGATGHGVGIDIAGRPGGVAIEYGGAHGSMPGVTLAHRAGSGSGAAEQALGVGGVARPTRYGIEFGELLRSGVPYVDWSHSAGATGHGVGIDKAGRPGGVAIEQSVSSAPAMKTGLVTASCGVSDISKSNRALNAMASGAGARNAVSSYVNNDQASFHAPMLARDPSCQNYFLGLVPEPCSESNASLYGSRMPPFPISGSPLHGMNGGSPKKTYEYPDSCYCSRFTRCAPIVIQSLTVKSGNVIIHLADPRCT